MTGDIVITITVKELRHGKRPIIVSAAPAGEMPLIITGHFPDRYTLIDDAFAQLLTRKSKVVKVASEKKVADKKDGAGEEDVDEAETTETPAPEPEPVQLVQEGLPVIAGDTAAQLLASADVLAGFDPNRVKGCTCGNTPCTCPF